MKKKLDYQLLIIKAFIDGNKQAVEETKKTLKKYESEFTKINTEFTNIKTTISQLLVQNQHSSLGKVDSLKSQYQDTVVQANKKYPPLEDGKSTKIGGMWTLKHEISSPKLYEILIKTEPKGETALGFNNSYNHIHMCLNAINGL